MPPIVHNRWQTNPPWENLELPINLELAEFPRAETQGLVYRCLFLELKYKYKDFNAYYTDGSVIENRSGCAIINHNNVYRYRLSDLLSKFTCEATAILKVLEIIKMNMNKCKTVIYSDSKSCLIAIGNLSNKNFLIRKIQETLLDLLRSGHTINLV